MAMGKSELFADAAAVWKMLDEMAVNDPVGYKAFIEKNLKEGRKTVSPPSSKFVIKAKMKESKRLLIVNYCEWAAVPDSKSETSPIIVKCGETFPLGEDTGIAMAFNPHIFTQHDFPAELEQSNSSTLPQAKTRREEDSRYQLIWLGLHYLEMEKKMPTIESNSVICSSAPLRPKILHPADRYGTKEQILSSLGYFNHLLISEQKRAKQDFVDPIGEAVQQILHNSSENGVGHRNVTESEEPDELYFSESQPFKLPHQHTAADATTTDRKKSNVKLIEELGEACSSEARHKISWHAEIITAIQKEKSKSHANKLKLTFELPGITSSQQCDLDLTEDKLLLTILDSRLINYQPLELELPCRINYEKAEAKFNPKRERLQVIAPIMPSAPTAD
ncbi:PIH1 domain-containing protein 2 [Clonorchis sinensis]|uniref:PIH1 domain-containing protein 2 n=1 Tax=Clonorchis sinensis TaxID=79923 RepID=H2KR39_CLOSI|nr:PIH1 domain-containing protein 2 [Clonorchis sinensis]